MAERVRVYIAFGSSIDPEHNVPRALELLAEKMELQAIATLYRTPALERPGDPDFVNGVCAIETDLDPRTLKFGVLRVIEETLGRVRGADAYAPRTVDLDIAVYGEVVVNEPGLRIPDPDIRTRAFLAVPLWELEPALILADTGETIGSVVERVDRSGLRPDAVLTKTIRERLKI